MSQITNFTTGGGGGGVVSVTGGHDIFISGTGTNPIVNVTNAITLGDLAVIPAFGPAITATTGDLVLSSGNIRIPASTAFVGRIDLGNTTFINNFGTQNSFLGSQSGSFLLTVGSAIDNVGIGFTALSNITTGRENTAVGSSAMQNLNTGIGNTGIGFESLLHIANGQENTALGSASLVDMSSGNSNVAIGFEAHAGATAGDENTMVGAQTALSLATGSNNIILGFDAAANLDTNESDNIIIGNAAVIGDNNTIRIGTQGSGPHQQDTCYIAGISGVTTANSQMVTINTSTNQLGSAAIPSSVTWQVITGNVMMVSNNGYIANNAGTSTLTLPTTSAVGDILEVTGINNATGWTIAQNASQQIFFGNTSTTAGVGGSLSSTATRDSLRMVCVVANLTWNVLSSIGNITVV